MWKHQQKQVNLWLTHDYNTYSLRTILVDTTAYIAIKDQLKKY